MLFPFRNSEYPTRLKLHGKYGLIDKKGIEICPIKYTRIDSFDGDGKAFAESGKNNMFYINKNGEETPINSLVSK